MPGSRWAADRLGRRRRCQQLRSMAMVLIQGDGGIGLDMCFDGKRIARGVAVGGALAAALTFARQKGVASESCYSYANMSFDLPSSAESSIASEAQLDHDPVSYKYTASNSRTSSSQRLTRVYNTKACLRHHNSCLMRLRNPLGKPREEPREQRR